MKYLEFKGTDPYRNLAFEEYVLKNRMDGDYLLVWQNENTIVVGRHQNTDEEINHSYVSETGIHVVRRNTGGGAVFHDLGNVNFSFITDLGESEKLTMSRFTDPVINALGELGIKAYQDGRNDILVDGKKVSGNAQFIYKNRILHHGTLLYQADLKRASMALQVHPDKFVSKSTKSVRSRIGNLTDFMEEEKKMSVDEFMRFLVERLTDEREFLEEKEKEQIEKLADEKYRTWEWNYGESPEFDYHNRTRYTGGTLETGICVAEGRIQTIKFYGDYMAVRPVDEVCSQLIGCQFNRESMERVLMGLDIKKYFGAITCQEILDCIF